MSNIKCSRCGKEEKEEVFCVGCGKNLRHQLHHLIPKYCFDNKKEADKFGRRWLCGNCHHILHRMIEAILFKKFVPKEKKEECKAFLKSYSLNWINKK